MNFLIQTDNVMQVEKRAISHASAISDYELLYCSYDDMIYDYNYCPIGSVEFVNKIFDFYNFSLENISYPTELFQFLLRNVYKGTVKEADNNDFIKPIETKLFTGGIKSTLNIEENTPVWISTPVNFISEVRYYIHNNKILGYGRYDPNDNDLMPNVDIIEDAILKFESSPISYSIDFGVLDTGKTALVEVNDAWALGYYKDHFSTKDYAFLIYERWKQIMGIHSH